MELNYEDEKVWDLIKSGRTKGVFQLETSLGKSWAKKCQPDSIEDLSALIAILRPGVLKSNLDGKSLAQHYADRKIGLDQVTYIHESLRPMLEKTFGVLTYQEQVIEISKIIAGFSESEADVLRKAIGKKASEKFAQLRLDFINGCAKVGTVTPEIAGQIFDWIEKCSRYSFNKCLGKLNQIKTQNGYKFIKDVKIGDEVDSPNGFIPVKNIYKNGIRKVFLAFFDLSDPLWCTLDHKLLCRDGELRPMIEVFAHQFEVKTTFGYATIDEISYVDEEETYDIEVDSEDHVFYAGNIAVSNSHSITYAENGFESAYYKLYNTHKFFEVYLNHSKKDQNEIKELVNDAKFFGIETYPPRLKYLYPKFTNIGNSIYFGLTLVKDVGETECNKMMDLIAETEKKISKKKEEWGWFDLLVNIFGNVNKKVVTALTSVGAFNGENNRVTRNRMIYEYGVWSKLPDSVTEWITENYRNYEGDRLEILVRAAVNNIKINSRSLPKVMDLLTMLGSPPYDLEDTPESISDMEENFLGIALTCSKTDAKGVYSVNSTCKDVDLGKIPSKPVLCVKIDEFREWKTKNDSIMVFLKVEDSTGMLDVVMFEEQYNEHRNLIRKGNIVLIVCEQSKKKSGLIVKDLHQM